MTWEIEDFDEFQGLTGDMVTAWLFAHEWQRMPEQDLPRSECWVRKGGSGGTVWIGVDCSAEKTLLKLAAWMDCSVQALLREINPRIRKGMPSGEALAMHDRWVVRKPDGAVIMCCWRPPYMVNVAGGGDFALREQCYEWAFWPCDEHGNKVRWPEKDGVML